MQEEIKAIRYECDAPVCTTVIITDDPGEAYGFHGQVSEISRIHGNCATWFACKSAHIKPAVLAALVKAWSQ